jgi:hypothetical protein
VGVGKLEVFNKRVINQVVNIHITIQWIEQRP